MRSRRDLWWWSGALALLTWSLSSCDGLKYGLSEDYKEACSKAACDHGDVAAIGGNLAVNASAPLRVSVETCRDDTCDESHDFEVAPGTSASHDSLLILSGRCPESPFECADPARWWVGWSVSALTDAGLVQTYRIVVRDRESGEVLEDHTFTADYRFEEARDCARVANRRDGGYINFTCAHFAATWE